MPTRCTATTAAGRPCRAWAVRGSDPPRCAAHRAAPEAAVERETAAPGQSSLAAQIADLDRRIARLGAYMDACQAELNVDDLVRLNDLYSKMMGRVTRMRQALDRLGPGEGAEQSALAKALHWALDELAKILKTEL
jgi:hypothetical protein